jgi:hypothetical protein
MARAEQVTATWRRAGARYDLGNGLVWLAVVYARAGRPDDAHAAMREALALFREADSPIGVASVLQGLTYLVRWQDRHEDAVRLAGAVETLRERLGGRAPLDFLAAFIGDPEAESRVHLPRDRADRAFTDGRALSVDAAIALATGAP